MLAPPAVLGARGSVSGVADGPNIDDGGSDFDVLLRVVVVVLLSLFTLFPLAVPDSLSPRFDYSDDLSNIENPTAADAVARPIAAGGLSAHVAF